MFNSFHNLLWIVVIKIQEREREMRFYVCLTCEQGTSNPPNDLSLRGGDFACKNSINFQFEKLVSWIHPFRPIGHCNTQPLQWTDIPHHVMYCNFTNAYTTIIYTKKKKSPTSMGLVLVKPPMDFSRIKGSARTKSTCQKKILNIRWSSIPCNNFIKELVETHETHSHIKCFSREF